MADIFETSVGDGPDLYPCGPVLLVEDQAPNILIGQTYLEMFGYEVDVAVNGLMACEKAAMRRYEAIVMDVEMPGMDGLAATAAIRADEASRQANHVPIVILTSHSDPRVASLCEQAGADLVVRKPMTLALQRVLAELTKAA
jgi:CheY-like chemotaxis protein